MEQQQRERMKKVCKDITETCEGAKLYKEILEMTPTERYFWAKWNIRKEDYEELIECCDDEMCLASSVKNLLYPRLGQKKMMDYLLTMMKIDYVYQSIYDKTQEGYIWGKNDGFHLSFCNSVMNMYKIIGKPDDINRILRTFFIGMCWYEGLNWRQAIKKFGIAGKVIVAKTKETAENPLKIIATSIEKISEVFIMEEGHYHPVPVHLLGTPSLTASAVEEV